MINLFINILILELVFILTFLIIQNQYNIIYLFLVLELSYIVILVMLNFLSLQYNNVIFSSIFIYLIAIATIKSVVGICFFINYIRVYSSIYL